ncbi:ABC transporter ATP-binding protein [Planctomycetes bacterium K23_9]|uniref:Multidrug export ATP-binding/permease protein n=1 Tax=Stieleria marina TaxID=1930275 RepID=A0A517NZF8_9BACT|nr:Putative multidrug export ATP-binding/permease protein [Planctomycetes bacterium K23_9]
MNNFGRVLRISLRHKWSLAGILATSALIAVLWGANIGTLLPLIRVVFSDDPACDSMPEYAAKEIALANEMIAGFDAEIASLNQKLATADPAVRPTIEKLIGKEVQKKKDKSGSVYYMQLVQPYLDKYAPTTPFSTLRIIVFLLVVSTVIKLIALMGNMLMVQYVSQRTAVDLRAIFYRKALHLDLDSFGENGSADLTARLTNDIALVSAGVTVLLGKMVREPLKLVVCIGSAAYLCPRLLLFVMVLTPILALVMQHLSRAIRRASRRAMEEMSQLYGMLNDSFAGIRVIKAFNTQAFERARFSQGINAYFRKSMKMAFYNTLARSSSELMGMITVGLAILAGGYLVLNQKTHLLGLRITYEPLDPGQICLFFAFLIGASDPARKLTDVWSRLQGGIAATTRIYEIIDAPVRVHEPSSPQAVNRPHHRIEFSDVSYQYPAGPTVLRGVDLTIRHGETIAVVGPNGSGKSTLVSLLCRFDDPQGGTVSLDGVPLSDMRTRDLRKRLALVTQRTILFDDTIENNIRYGTPGADSHAVVRAAKMAFADDFIHRKTPNGYQTVLGASGMRLSGGQMQRIALARAFLRNPDILILDEATSQIDLESEQLIHEALAKFLVDRTGVMITHRPTSLAMADRIVVIESGKVADSGLHEDLFARNRFYQSLCGVEQRKSA